MPTQYTSLLGYALPVTGELSGLWGNVVNDSVTQLVEDSIAGVATASVASGDWTLTTTGSGASNQARMAILRPTGSPGVTRNIIAPSSSKAYIVDNNSNAAVVLKGSATTGVSIAAGTISLCVWDGSDFVVVGSTASGTVTSITAGTGLTGGTITSSGTIAIDTGVVTTLTGIQTLTNKTLTAPVISTISNTGTLTLPTTTDTLVGRATTDTLTNKTLTSPTINTPTIAGATLNDGYTEEVYAVVDAAGVALSPTNGSIQTWTLGASRTPTAGTWAAGQSMVLMINDGTAYTVTWTSLPVTWVGGAAPTLATSGFSVITLWKVGTTIYGSFAGSVA